MGLFGLFKQKIQPRKAKIVLAAMLLSTPLAQAHASSALHELSQKATYTQNISDSQAVTRIRHELLQRELSVDEAHQIIQRAHSSVRIPILKSFVEMQSDNSRALAETRLLETAKYITQRNRIYLNSYREQIQLMDTEKNPEKANTYYLQAGLEFRKIFENNQILLALFVQIEHNHHYSRHFHNELAKEVKRNLHIYDSVLR
ncbi:MAG: hypothetical protein ACMXYA_01075 [Candidatus Woesearchaeota archaeon]